MNKPNTLHTKRLTHTAIFIAIITVLTLLVKIPFKPTQGYLTLADAGVYTAAFLLGPALGGIAGGIGTALADLLSGYPIFILLSLLAHGLQAVVAATVQKLLHHDIARMIVGCIGGTLVMTAIYFLGETFVLDIAVGAALLEVPGNICQNVAGAFVAIPLTRTIRKIYPQINELARK